jgi:glycosyltransferase involved in cell wall biosynthesis
LKQVHPKVSVVIPLFNELSILKKNLNAMSLKFNHIFGTGKWKFVLIDNGSNDGSIATYASLQETWCNMQVIFLDKPDYGKAMRCGIEQCQTRFVHIVNIEQWDHVFAAYCWLNRHKYDLFIGSKRADPLINHQSWYRKFLSWGLNSTLSLLFETVAIDTHGPKFLDLNTMSQTIQNTVMTRGQFDTEFTIKAIRSGHRVCEAPTEYIEQRPPRNFMITKIFRNIYDIYFLWRELSKHPQTDLLRFARTNRWEELAAAKKLEARYAKR